MGSVWQRQRSNSKTQKTGDSVGLLAMIRRFQTNIVKSKVHKNPTVVSSLQHTAACRPLSTLALSTNPPTRAIELKSQALHPTKHILRSDCGFRVRRWVLFRAFYRQPGVGIGALYVLEGHQSHPFSISPSRSNPLIRFIFVVQGTATLTNAARRSRKLEIRQLSISDKLLQVY
ncbi:hypothetical protein CRG98_026096 [Punica granatum]|uniref:Uncharacterized protein n=1 Tax=Punica granatum TaxID=22663 RepID=A0A2I0JBC4_PUNGR|nr:hypothetical protein CRG98_026096 [Punica granatum]